MIVGFIVGLNGKSNVALPLRSADSIYYLTPDVGLLDVFGMDVWAVSSVTSLGVRNVN